MANLTLFWYNNFEAVPFCFCLWLNSHRVCNRISPNQGRGLPLRQLPLSVSYLLALTVFRCCSDFRPWANSKSPPFPGFNSKSGIQPRSSSAPHSSTEHSPPSEDLSSFTLFSALFLDSDQSLLSLVGRGHCTLTQNGIYREPMRTQCDQPWNN